MSSTEEKTAEQKTYEGGCHCGAVRWSIRMAEPEKVFTGNCSLCKRDGWVIAFAKGDALQLLRGEENLTDYQFGKKNVHHVFCKTCGVRSFSRGTMPSGEAVAAINLRCIDDYEVPSSLPVHAYDCAKL